MKNAVLTSNAAAIERGAMETETIQKNGASPKSLMSRGNFLRLIAAFFAVGVIFIGCDKDEDKKEELVSSAFDGTITATVEKGNDYNSQVSRVAAEVYTRSSDQYEELASGNYTNGKFTLKLPATPAAKYLELLADGAYDFLNISDKSVKILQVDEFYAYSSSGSEFDQLIYTKLDRSSEIEVAYMYVDKDVTITGSGKDDEDEMSFSLLLKKGWNVAYRIETETAKGEKEEITTKPVSGLKWYFRRDIEDFYRSPGAQKVQVRGGAKRSFFKK